jgi:hypothetical protein
MREQDLEEVMGRFVRGEVDILVSTMIVESGLDVPNANTMIVDRADRFGLAQLYQLRGRVGRSHRRAFAYLLVPDLVDTQAEERLQVLEHHTDLGSGYRIALRDLELRGAGNLLGGEQSGHVQAVGFDMYLRWLEETVRGLKQEPGAGSREQFSPPDVTPPTCRTTTSRMTMRSSICTGGWRGQSNQVRFKPFARSCAIALDHFPQMPSGYCWWPSCARWERGLDWKRSSSRATRRG